mmetsp:Transcript_41831/g.111103  ORF Transcript_41831/g.111103 Transcript_41831/m.111103 type:complete len:312 (-) Transcript_41831:100-1035(-)
MCGGMGGGMGGIGGCGGCGGCGSCGGCGGSGCCGCGGCGGCGCSGCGMCGGMGGGLCGGMGGGMGCGMGMCGGMGEEMQMQQMQMQNMMQMQMMAQMQQAQMMQAQAASRGGSVMMVPMPMAMMGMQGGFMTPLGGAGCGGMPCSGCTGVPGMPCGGGICGEEEAEVNCTPEELSAMEEEVKEMEASVRKDAKSQGLFLGLMARYIEDEGFGFVHCPECKDVWDKTDMFLSGRTFVSSGVDVGDMITFEVEKDGKDLPRATNPKCLKELTAARKKLGKMREAMKRNLLKRALGPAEAGGWGGCGAKQARLA